MFYRAVAREQHNTVSRATGYRSNQEITNYDELFSSFPHHCHDLRNVIRDDSHRVAQHCYYQLRFNIYYSARYEITEHSVGDPIEFEYLMKHYERPIRA